MPDLLARLSRSWKGNRVVSAPLKRRLFRCLCARPLFFRNSRCLGCGAEVGYDAEQATLLTLPADQQAAYRITTGRGRAQVERSYVRCANYTTPAWCNWLVPVTSEHADTAQILCRSCRLDPIVRP